MMNLDLPDDYSYADALRAEAMTLFEHCLTEGRPHLLETFVQEQLSLDPPPLDLLRDVADDLHGRLQALRESQFDVRDRVLSSLLDAYHVDLSVLAPPNALDRYHLIQPEAALYLIRQHNPLSAGEEEHVRRTLAASLALAAQIHHDVIMTEHLYGYLMDWLAGFNAAFTRRFLAGTAFTHHDETLH